MKAARTRIGLRLVVLAVWCSGPVCFADPVHKPHHSTPTHPARAAPDVTGTIAKPPLPVAPNRPAPDAGHGDEQVPPPFKLPAASRARVRACGERWRDMKLAGTTGDGDWRDFAMKCYVGKGSTALAN